MKKLIARDEYGCKVKLTQDEGFWVDWRGIRYVRDGNKLVFNGEHGVHDLMIISEEDVTVTTNAGIWTTNGNTTTVPWDVASTTMYMASPIRDSTYNPPRWNFPHPETREPVTRENLYDWIIQAAVDGKIKRCDHEEHYTKIQCPACQGVGWVLK